MAITANVNVSTTPIELTVKLDASLAAKRSIDVDITVLGETVHASAYFPIKVVDAERTWTLKTDDGVTAVYTASA